jgi:hypothetical protein
LSRIAASVRPSSGTANVSFDVSVPITAGSLSQTRGRLKTALRELIHSENGRDRRAVVVPFVPIQGAPRRKLAARLTDDSPVVNRS